MNVTTKKLTNTAIMIALAEVLSFFTVFQGINGGDVTIGSAVPIILIAFMYNTPWGILTSLVYTLVNMLLKGIVTTLPTEGLYTYFMMILLDYVLAFGVLGLAGWFSRKMGGGSVAMTVSAAIVVFLRFVCHYASGIILWGSYAPEGQSVWLYSLLYNGGYMLPELIITTVIVGILSVKVIPMIIEKFR